MTGIAGIWDPRGSASAPEAVARMLRALGARGAVTRVRTRGPATLGMVGPDESAVAFDLAGGDWTALDGWCDQAAGPNGAPGEAWLASLRGEFALARSSDAPHRLWIVRDPTGVRPLFYARAGDVLWFASEIKALLADARVPRTVYRDGLAELVGYRYMSGDRTSFEAVRRVEPGTAVVVDADGASRIRYWDLPYGGRAPGFGGTALSDAVRREVRDAVVDALRPGVPTGVLLSGGIDSGIVLALAARAQGTPPLAFTAGSPDPRLDETERAAALARALGAEHVVAPIDGEAYARALPEAIAAHDEPLHHPNAVALHLLVRGAAPRVGALLMGEGADSSFGNRSALKLFLANTLRGLAPAALWSVAARGSAALGFRHGHALAELVRADSATFTLESNLFTSAAVAAALTRAAGPDAVTSSRRAWLDEIVGLDPIARLLRYYQKTELVASFDVFGSMLAAHGVAPAMPFGNRRLQELTCRLPSRVKVTLRGVAKPLLVDLARELLPGEALRWPKLSFGFPLAAWFRAGGPLHPYLALATGKGARIREWLDPGRLLDIAAENERGAGNHGEGALFVAVNLEIWARLRLEGASPDEVHAAAERATAA